MTYKPNGYPSLLPYLMVDGASETIAFLTTVFGAKELLRVMDDGRIAHAEIMIDKSVLMLADGNGTYQTASVYVYVEDVDAVYKTAMEAGAISIQEPIKKDDPDKRGGFKDPAGGTIWWIATKVD
jgi:PhnB protein